MAFSFGFFNAKNLDRTYTAENFCDYLGSIICNGIQDNYGRCFDLSAGTGLSVTVGTGKAWINGHYFINDARYSIDLSEYMDESLPRYVGIVIYLDTTEAVRNVSLRLFPGTPAENPGLPSIPQDEDHVRLLMYAVRLNPGATSLSDRDWFDYREDRNVCGYCQCILGKCKVTDMLAEMAQMLQLTGRELARGKATLPAYRALYLDELLSGSDGIQVSRDSQLRSMIRNFKTLSESDYALPSGLNAQLRSYQQIGYQWLKTLEGYGFGGILADEMGLGKTLQMIAFLATVPQKTAGVPNLVICPASLIYNWGDELQKFAPQLRYQLILGNAAERERLRAASAECDVWVARGGCVHGAGGRCAGRRSVHGVPLQVPGGGALRAGRGAGRRRVRDDG